MIKRTTSDGHFSDCIRIREDYTCEHCKTHIYEGDRQAAQSAHLVSRKFNSLRVDPDNACMLCASCHASFGDDPILFNRWLVEYFGDAHLDKLQQKKERVMKGFKKEEKERSKHYLKEFRRMTALRNSGLEGRIEFKGYYDE